MKKPYPITITQSRYGGTYEGGSWVAFHCDPQEVPWPAFADDMTCSTWWTTPINVKKVGVGWSPEEAYENLLKRLS